MKPYTRPTWASEHAESQSCTTSLPKPTQNPKTASLINRPYGPYAETSPAPTVEPRTVRAVRVIYVLSIHGSGRLHRHRCLFHHPNPEGAFYYVDSSQWKGEHRVSELVPPSGLGACHWGNLAYNDERVEWTGERSWVPTDMLTSDLSLWGLKPQHV